MKVGNKSLISLEENKFPEALLELLNHLEEHLKSLWPKPCKLRTTHNPPFLSFAHFSVFHMGPYRANKHFSSHAPLGLAINLTQRDTFASNGQLSLKAEGEKLWILKSIAPHILRVCCLTR